MRPEDRERPLAGAVRTRDPRLGPLARCLSRGRTGGRLGAGAVPPARAAADAVAAREACQRRLQRVAQAYAMATQSWPEVRRELIDTLLHMRVLSMDVVETIETWRKNGREGSLWPDPHTGDNYLLKMKDDTRWLADSPLGEILRFSPKSDPFFVVPSTSDSAQPPTNQMTPTLQAQRRQLLGAAGEQRRAVLPLQSSLLRRIRAAELYILKESVQARLQLAGAFSVPQAAGDGFLPGRAVPLAVVPPSADLAAAAAAAYSPAAAQAAGLAVPPRPLHQAPPQQPLQPRPHLEPLPRSELLQPVKLSEAEAPATAAAKVEDAAFAAPAKPRPPLPVLPEDGVFTLLPVAATKAAAGDLFARFGARVEPAMFKSMDQWESLKEALEDDGAGAPEWFWLLRRDRAGGLPAAASPESADGLVVFRLKRASTTFGQLLHLSVVDAAWVEEALAAVKARMFALLPIKSIRATLWYNNLSGEMQLNKDFAECFKKERFRWFQLLNVSATVRGQVMNCPRLAAPEDPPMPAEDFAIEVCLGQVWSRGCTGMNGVVHTKRPGMCASNLVLASACLRQFWERDAAAVAAVKEASGETRELALASVAAKEGLVRGLLSGELEKLLSRFSPVAPPSEGQGAAGGGGSISSTALTVSLAKALDAGGKKCRSVPGALVEAAGSALEGAELVQRGMVAPGFAVATVGLALEPLPHSIEAMVPAEVVLGRLFVSLDWLGVVQLPGGGFQVPVLSAAACSRHPHPVFYMGTSEDDVFVVIIPWTGVPVPAEEGIFAACTDVVRNTMPMPKPPVQALRFDGAFDVRRTVRSFELPDTAAQLDLPAAPVAAGPRRSGGMRCSEFSSISVAIGRPAPGRLPDGDAAAASAVLLVQRPFAFCLIHTEIDDLNVPLSATLVS